MWRLQLQHHDGQRRRGVMMRVCGQPAAHATNDFAANDAGNEGHGLVVRQTDCRPLQNHADRVIDAGSLLHSSRAVKGCQRFGKDAQR